MSAAVIFAVFPIIFIGELPDKTMFASLLLASRGKPLAVWIGAATAFLVHVVIAVSIGEALFHLLPHRVVDGIVAGLFLIGAVFSYRSRNEEEGAGEDAADVKTPLTAMRTSLTAGGVIFLAEWGDLTQILTANLAAKYHDALSVGIGAVVALWAVAGIAVISGSRLMAVISVKTLRIITSVVLVGLAIYSAVNAAGG